MARVVQWRNAPPYLLIVFVFLFLIAAALAVLGFMGTDKADKENQEKDTQVLKLREENEKLTTHANDLVQLVTGKPGTAANAIQAANAAYNNPDYKALGGERGGLAPELVNLSKTIKDQKESIDSLNRQLKQGNEELANKDAAIKKQLDEHRSEVAQLNRQKAALAASMKEETEARTEVLKNAEENLAGVRKKLEDNIKAKEKQLEALVLQRLERDRTIAPFERNSAISGKKSTLPRGI